MDMSDKLFDLFSKELKRLGKPSLFVIAGLGEPSLHPKFTDFLFRLDELFPGTHIRLFTNGVRLDRHLRDVLACCDSVVVGLNFAGEQNYESFTGTKYYDRVMGNVECLLGETEIRHSPLVAVQLLDVKQNLPYSVELSEWLKPRLHCNSRFQRVELVNFTGLVDVSGYVMGDDVLAEGVPRFPCFQLWKQLFFCANGDVYPCCVGTPLRGQLLLGNIGERRLVALVKGDRLREVRENALRGDYVGAERCFACNVWKREPNPWLRFAGKWR